MTYLSASVAFMLLSITSALATTAAPSTTGGSSWPTLPIMGDTSLTAHFWIALGSAIAAAGLWYYNRKRTQNV